MIEREEHLQSVGYADNDEVGVRGGVDVLCAVCFVVPDTESWGEERKDDVSILSFSDKLPH